MTIRLHSAYEETNVLLELKSNLNFDMHVTIEDIISVELQLQRIFYLYTTHIVACTAGCYS